MSKNAYFFLISGLPVRLSNLTFIWQAPNRNVGSIRAVASVANKNIYQKLMSREIRHETFPVSHLLFYLQQYLKPQVGFGAIPEMGSFWFGPYDI